VSIAVTDHRLSLPRPVVREALRDLWPIAVAVAPFGLFVGVTLDELGIPRTTGYLSSLLIFSGSAQLAVLTLLDTGAGLTTIVAIVAVVGARLVVYGGALAPHFRAQPVWFRWFGPHLLVDQTFGVATARSDLEEPGRFRAYWLTIGAGLGTVWLTVIVIGSLVGPVLDRLGMLELTAPALYVGMLVPRLSDRAAVGAAVVAAALAFGLQGLPGGVGLPIAIVVALAVGALTGWQRRETDR
jgi:predicted branched-subunit amino acid permease